MNVIKDSAPEEVELKKKQRLLSRLADTLATREERMADLRGALERFKTRYTNEVARYYAEFDEIEAQIAEEELKLVPDDEEIKKKVEELRRRAAESAVNSPADDEKVDWIPTREAKKAYHDLARKIHPDLVIDPAEKNHRHTLMAKLNLAYSSGNQKKLEKMVRELKISPETVKGDSAGDELVRTIRKIYQVRRRLAELKNEEKQALESELYELMQKSKSEELEGRDLLRQMGERAKSHIRKAARRLENLKSVNEAQGEYVRERYGIDIKDFRK